MVIADFMETTNPHEVGSDPDYQDQGPGFPGQDSLEYVIDLGQRPRPDSLSVRAEFREEAPVRTRRYSTEEMPERPDGEPCAPVSGSEPAL